MAHLLASLCPPFFEDQNLEIYVHVSILLHTNNGLPRCPRSLRVGTVVE